jgi:hypothetical protein
MSDEIVERGKLQPPRIRRAHEEDPLVVSQRLAGKITKALPLFIAEGGKDGVAFPPEDQLRGAGPGQFLERHFLAHTVEDVPEDLGAEPRRFDVRQVLVRYPLVGDELQSRSGRCRSGECPDG